MDVVTFTMVVVFLLYISHFRLFESVSIGFLDNGGGTLNVLFNHFVYPCICEIYERYCHQICSLLFLLVFTTCIPIDTMKRARVSAEEKRTRSLDFFLEQVRIASLFASSLVIY